jgi:hypothetical protein
MGDCFCGSGRVLKNPTLIRPILSELWIFVMVCEGLGGV